MATSAVACSRHLQRLSPWHCHDRYRNLSQRTLCPPSPGPDSHISFTFMREVPAWKLKMKQGTAWVNQAKPKGAPLIPFLGKEGKAPQSPYLGLFPAAIRMNAIHGAWLLISPPSPRSAHRCFHLPTDAWRLSSVPKLCPGM